MAGVAAAAAIVALAAVTLPHLGGEQRSNKTEIAPGAGLASSGPERGSDNIGTAAPIQIVLLKGRSYSAVDLQDLATSTASASASAPTGTSGTADETASAIRCLATAGAPKDAQLVTLIGAAFEKNPAAIGVYLQGPGADQPADKVLVLAASLDTCQVLSFVQANIG